ncbi:MAG: 50S ribosomal protein L6 [Clostridia bacterium]|jgi:large subunit ribosomal protein L6|nr:50S ribosomal protein L6 [Clostridia bacterium]
MSRIGKQPVTIPAGVDVKVAEGNLVTVKGPKGTLEKQMPVDIKIEVSGSEVVVTRANDTKTQKSLHGLTRTLVFNMVEGVTVGFKKTLEIKGVGYKAQKQGKKLNLSLGYSHPVEMEDPEGITTTVEGNTTVVVEGIDKAAVGQYAAEIRAKRKPEPYKGKGVRYSDERIRMKEGKSGK